MHYETLKLENHIRALSSVWTECLASDQAVAGSNPAAPIQYLNDVDSYDGVDPYLNLVPLSRVISLRSVTFPTFPAVVLRFARFKHAFTT